MSYTTKVRPDKVDAAEKIKTALSEVPVVMLTEYRGLTVTALAELRHKLNDVGVTYKVVKNTLARIAATDLGHEGLVEYLTGPTAIAYCSGDPVVAARTLADFAKEHPELVIKGGILDGRVLAPEQTSDLATVDTLDVSRAKIAGLLTSGLRGIASMLEAPARKILFVLEELGKREGDAPAEAAAEEAEVTAEPQAAEQETEGETDAATPEAANSEAPAAEAASEPEATDAPQAEAPDETEDAAAEPEAGGDDSTPDKEGE